MNKNYLIKNLYRILIVDDEASMRLLAAEALKGFGFQVMDFASPLEALDYLKQHPTDFDLMMLDMVMPEMYGDKLFGCIQEINPFVPVLILSGLEGVEVDFQGLLSRGLKKILKKPISGCDLACEVERVLKESQSIQIDVGLATMMNNEKLYLKIMEIYYEDYRQLSDKLMALLGEEKYEDIQRWVHKVKGVSLNIGSQTLYDQSKDLDYNLRNKYFDSKAIQQFALYHEYIMKDVERIFDAQHGSNI